MLAYFDQPEIHAKIVDYVHTHQLDLENIDEDALLNMMNWLQLLDDIQQKIKEETVVN